MTSDQTGLRVAGAWLAGASLLLALAPAARRWVMARCAGSVLRRSRIRAVPFEQSLQLVGIPWLDQIRIETCGEARFAEVRVRIATEGDQAELRRRKPLTETTTQL
jgi:hypothetical protein